MEDALLFWNFNKLILYKSLQSTDCARCKMHVLQIKNTHWFNVLTTQLLKKGHHYHVAQLPFKSSDLCVDFQMSSTRKIFMKWTLLFSSVLLEHLTRRQDLKYNLQTFILVCFPVTVLSDLFSLMKSLLMDCIKKSRYTDESWRLCCQNMD